MGVDAEAEAIRLAAQEFKRRGIVNCQAMNLRIDQAREHFHAHPMHFDLVWSMDVIEHLPDPVELLRLASEVPAPGGSFVLGTPLFIRPELVSPYHVREFCLAELRSLLSPHFSVERETLLAQTRSDGRLYPDSYYVAHCKRGASFREA